VISGWEISANALNTISVLLAGRNSSYTWITGIVGCLLFVYVYFGAKLYADVTLQIFFIVTSIVGWRNWLHSSTGTQLPIQRSSSSLIIAVVLMGASVTLGYGWLLHRFTDAFAPFLDSIILAFSVIAQFLLMGRRIETWYCWLLVNSIAVPLYCRRGLFLTALLYAAFWINAIVSLFHWRKLMKMSQESRVQSPRSEESYA